MTKPELLAPAKNIERLKVAVAYGADAVYVGGPKYGLRARADNFTDAELIESAAFAHQHGAKLYLTLNAFLHDDDFDGLADYCRFLASIGIDALIISDLGVLQVARQSCNIDIHLSTQASCLNSYAAQAWKAQGVKRLILGRELTIAEAGQIQQQADIEVELFTHGAMCMAYSGHCTISNFTAGRDSNRGGCVQSCRFTYRLHPDPITSFIPINQLSSSAPIAFMSSKDLWGIDHLDDFFKHGIHSLKIEGRMKSSLYVATTVKSYRQLIDSYANNTLTPALLNRISQEMQSIPHRDYFSGSLNTPAGPASIFEQSSNINTGSHKYLGSVIETDPHIITLRLLEPVAVGHTIEILPFHHKPIRHQVDQLHDVTGHSIQTMRKDSVVCLPRTAALEQVEPFNVVRIRDLEIGT